MGTALKVAGGGAGVLALILFFLALVAAPTLLVGGLVSVLFGIGFWVASGYVLLARIAVGLLFHH